MFVIWGIAQSCATTAKFNSITLQDVSEQQLSKAKTRITQSLTNLKEKKRGLHFIPFYNFLLIECLFVFSWIPFEWFVVCFNATLISVYLRT
jgi:hypothetical protein